MMTFGSMSPTGVSVQGPLTDMLPSLVGSHVQGVDLMGLDNFGSPTGLLVGAGIGALVGGAVVTFGMTWLAFKLSRDGSNWKPAAVMAAPGLLFGVLALTAAAGAAT